MTFFPFATQAEWITSITTGWSVLATPPCSPSPRVAPGPAARSGQRPGRPAAVACAAGATRAGWRNGLISTPPLPHRVTLVACRDGVSWYDDSKATTPASVLAAVAGFPSVVLIAGGHNKGLDLAALREAVPPLRAVVAIGEAAGEVENAFRSLAPLCRATSMEAAVDGRPVRLAHPGDAVLLSPGCSSRSTRSQRAALAG